jgi:hypothetical protein
MSKNPIRQSGIAGSNRVKVRDRIIESHYIARKIALEAREYWRADHNKDGRGQRKDGLWLRKSD